ncbi:MAG: hypothetical protein ACYDCK_01350 [Thermoplasmatota archaeon]
MRANRRARAAHDDDRGQLMMLAGIILILAFIVTALTLSQISDLEKQASQEQSSPLLNEYRAVRDKIGSTLADATGTGTDNGTFKSTFKSIVAGLKGVEQAKGYDVVAFLAGSPANAGIRLNRTEWSFTDLGKPDNYTGGAPTPGSPAPESGANIVSAKYTFHSSDNLVTFNEPPGGGTSTLTPYDRGNDGIVWRKAGCLKGGGTCIQAAIVYLYLADSTTSVEETIAYSVNTS